MAEKVANQYADYLKVEMAPGVKTIEDTIDETLTRLDEYSGLIDMVIAESCVQKCNSILACKDELKILFEKVRKLEFVVARIKSDVYKVETLVDKAETDHGISTGGKLRRIINPFFKRVNSVSVQERSQLRFEPPELFNTKDFFI